MVEDTDFGAAGWIAEEVGGDAVDERGGHGTHGFLWIVEIGAEETGTVADFFEQGDELESGFGVAKGGLQQRGCEDVSVD